MALRTFVYNTLSRKKEMFKPFKGNLVRLFVCGPTVYGFSHIGHARTYVLFDCFAKYLKHLGYKVQYLQNITDVDDKIIARAREKQVSPKDLALAFEQEYLKDTKLLGITSVTKYARATHHIKEIIGQVQRLLKKGYAYALDDGIYFDIAKFKGYGKLAGRTALDADDSVSRIDYSAKKRNRGDFCLWKLRQEESEPSWPSPFGPGRPGWHIEDTAITEKYFGPQYEIHGGARDLIFPHHEAEVAQMEALSGKKPMAKYWMHTGFLTLQEQKMSKSLDNFITIDAFLKRYTPQQLRFFVAKHLWQSPVDYSESIMIEVKAGLERIEEFLRKIKTQNAKGKTTKQNAKLFEKAKESFYGALADNFNTPKAFAALFDFIKQMNVIIDAQSLNKKEATQIWSFFKEINSIFGIIDYEKVKQSNVPKEVLQLVSQREQARKSQDWQKSDEFREEIAKYGYEVEDTKAGPMLKKLELGS